MLAAGEGGDRSSRWDPRSPAPAPPQLQLPGERLAHAYVTHVSGGQHSGLKGRGKLTDNQATESSVRRDQVTSCVSQRCRPSATDHSS